MNKYPEIIIQNIASYSNSLDLKDLLGIREVSFSFYHKFNSLAWDRKNQTFSPWITFPKTKFGLDIDAGFLQRQRRKLDRLLATPQTFRIYDANGAEANTTLGYLFDENGFDHEKFEEFNQMLAPYITELKFNLVQVLDADPFMQTLHFDQFKNLQKLHVYFNIWIYEDKKRPTIARNECRLLEKLLNAYEGSGLEFVTIDFSGSSLELRSYMEILENELNSQMYQNFPNVRFVFSDCPSLKLLKNLIPEDISQRKSNFSIEFEAISFIFNENQHLDALRYLTPFVVNMDIRNEVWDNAQNPNFDMNSFTWTNLEELTLSNSEIPLTFLRNLPKLRILKLKQPNFHECIFNIDPNRTAEENFLTTFERLNLVETIEVETCGREPGLLLLTEAMINILKGMYRSVTFNLRNHPPVDFSDMEMDSDQDHEL